MALIPSRTCWVIFTLDDAVSGAARPDTSITTCALPPDSTSQGEWVCLYLSAAHKTTGLSFSFSSLFQSVCVRLLGFSISYIFLTPLTDFLSIDSSVSVFSFHFPLLLHSSHIFWHKTLQSWCVCKEHTDDGRSSLTEEEAGGMVGARDEVEMDELETWKQNVLLISVWLSRRLHGVEVNLLLLLCDGSCEVSLSCLRV